MGRKSQHNLPPGIQLDQHGAFWATLEGDRAKEWRERYPGRSLPRRKAKTSKEAIRLQQLLLDDLKANRDPNAENPTVVEWVQTCIDRKRKLAASTTTRYQKSLKWQIEPHVIGRLRIRQVQQKHVEDWVDALIVQRPQNKDDATLDPYTILRAFGLLRMAFNIAIEKGLLIKNPCKGVDLPRPDDEEIHPLTPDQVNTLLRYLGSLGPHRMLALYHVAIRCGLRLAELSGLRWQDIDLDRHMLSVSGQLKDKAHTNRGKTPRARRAHPLSTDTVEALRWHKCNQAEERKLRGEGWNAAGLVFVSENGTPLNPNNVERQFDRLLVKADLPDIRFHDLRHTYAALSLSAGVDLYTLSRRMGHSSIAITADRYGHLYSGNTEDVDAIDRLLKRSA